MADPFIERVTAMLRDDTLAHVGFRYQRQTLSGRLFADLIAKLVPVELSAATGIRQPTGRFGILINPSHPDWREQQATAMYDSHENVLVLRNRLVNVFPADLFHECWHAHCDLNTVPTSVFDEELVGYVWGAVGESVFGPCAEPAPVRFLPNGCHSAAAPLGRLLVEHRRDAPIEITGHPLTVRLEGFVRSTYRPGAYDNDG